MIVLVLQMVSAIPDDMTWKEFKREVSRANSYGFLSLSSTGTWGVCEQFCWMFHLSGDCSACSVGEVESNCAWHPDQMSVFDPWTSASAYCNQFFIPEPDYNKQCYCSVPQVGCSGGADTGDKKCEGDNVYKCSSSGVWEFYEDCATCENGACVTCTPRFEKRCDGLDVWYYDSCGNRDELKEVCDYKCENGNCLTDPCKYITCEDKCQNSIRYFDGYCSEGECVYQTETCTSGCSGKFCIEDPCKGILCEDACEDGIWYHDGVCSNGNCVYIKDTCQFGCENEPFLAIISGEGMCRDDSCVGVTCDDYCSENSLFYDGDCLAGKCTNFKEKLYAEECAVKSFYQRWYFWVGLGILIIFSIFAIRYWRRK